jgi:uncharacterized phage-associated protein
MPGEETKLEELVLFLAGELKDQGAAGATKLNKLLFYCDFVHVREHGRPITGAEYQRLPQGPAPRRLVPVRAQLVERGDAELREEAYLGRVQHRLVPLRDPDLSVFDADERETIRRVLGELGHMNGAELTALSHQELAWELLANGETIPYSGAFLRRGSPGQRTHELASKLLAELPPEITERF